MSLPFWPKLAGVEDAPNYRPTAGDSRCETCSFFRSLNDNAGYCERFSFEAEPESVCDEFSMAGKTKMSAAPAASVAERLQRLAQNPIARKAAVTGIVGAGAGGASAAYDTGPDAKYEAARGALLGGVLGTGAGLLGPAIRAGDARKAFEASNTLAEKAIKRGKTLNSWAHELLQLRDQRNLKRLQEEAGKINAFTNSVTELTKLHKAGKHSTPEAVQLADSISSAMPELNRMGVTTLADAQAKSKLLSGEINALTQSSQQLAQAKKNGDKALSLADKALEFRKQRGVQYNLKDLAKSDATEAIAVPGIAGLIAAGLGFGLSEDAREQQIYRKAKEGK